MNAKFHKLLYLTLIVTAVFSCREYFMDGPDTPVAGSLSDTYVGVLYFHRTNPCPTCQKMSAYTKEAVETGYAKQVTDGIVKYFYIDYEAHAQFAKAYKITRPSLVLIEVTKGKVTGHRNLTDIWTLSRDKQKFIRYVQDDIKILLNKR